MRDLNDRSMEILQKSKSFNFLKNFCHSSQSLNGYFEVQIQKILAEKLRMLKKQFEIPTSNFILFLNISLQRISNFYHFMNLPHVF